jgi:RimJ/RimL family protein N-acetyltransferase
MEDLFRGRLVRLASDDPEVGSRASARWQRNPEFQRLVDTEPPTLWSTHKIKEWIEKNLDKTYSDEYFFTIHLLEAAESMIDESMIDQSMVDQSIVDQPIVDQPIGFVGLRNVLWNQRDAWVGIGIGEAKYWGKGYGTDAMLLALRYGFMELNLERVSLSVFASNQRAIRSYEKAGFRPEGLKRQVIRRDGVVEDVLYMGILRQEWLAQGSGGENDVGR